MNKVIRKIGLVAHDGMKQDLIEWAVWNSERLIGHKFYCTGTTGKLVQEALSRKHPDIDWDITILKSGPLGGDQQMGSRIVEGEVDYCFFFTDSMTLQPHDTDIKALTRLAGVENIVFCCNRSTADHVISSPLFWIRSYNTIKGLQLLYQPPQRSGFGEQSGGKESVQKEQKNFQAPKRLMCHWNIYSIALQKPLP
jgi:methylglyoxal synthase